MNEYRCTRPALYPFGSLGHKCLGARQGHYVEAKSEEEARKIMEEDFPGEEIDVQLWEENI